MITGQPARKISGNRPSQCVLVIIPTFNELENLPVTHGRLKDAYPEIHVLIVDDGSPDGTGELADELAQVDPGCTHVMHRTTKDGLGTAYLAGFAWGMSRDYSVLVEMDADGSHAPEQLHRLLGAVDAGADLLSVRAMSMGGQCGTGRGSAWLCLRRPTNIRGWRLASTSTTSPPAIVPIAAKCSRQSILTVWPQRVIASRSISLGAL